MNDGGMTTETTTKPEDKSLIGLMICQFTGAFNDLALRWMIVFLAVAELAPSAADKSGTLQEMKSA